MKKITVLSFALIIAFRLFSQETQPAEHKPVNTDYLKKSKNQRKAGRILTITGASLMTAGLIGAMVETSAVVIGAEKPESAFQVSSAILFTGTATLVTGVTFLIIAKKNKKKALSMTFINEPSQQLRYNTVMNTSVPSVRLRLQF